MKVEYSAVFTREENGLYSVEFPNLPGCVTDGESRADAVSNAEMANQQRTKKLAGTYPAMPHLACALVARCAVGLSK